MPAALPVTLKEKTAKELREGQGLVEEHDRQCFTPGLDESVILEDIAFHPRSLQQGLEDRCCRHRMVKPQDHGNLGVHPLGLHPEEGVEPHQVCPA